MPRNSVNNSGSWPWRLFLFSLLVFVTVAVLFIGLEFGYKLFLENQITQQDEAINELSQSISAEDQERFLNFYSQLANLKNILDQHTFSSRSLSFLEENTNQAVYYDSVDVRVKESKITLEGVAASYEIFAQQLEAFNRASEVEQMVVQESQNVGGSVSFRLFLILSNETFS